jgi:hypothetical protein
MSTENPGSLAAPPVRAGWRQWLKLLGAACALLVLSQALWMWQTWPVRELLQPAAPAARPVPGPR